MSRQTFQRRTSRHFHPSAQHPGLNPPVVASHQSPSTRQPIAADLTRGLAHPEGMSCAVVRESPGFDKTAEVRRRLVGR